MFPLMRFKIVIASLSASLFFSSNLAAEQNRASLVLGMGFMAFGSNVMVAGLGGYGALEAVDRALLPELEKKKREEFQKLSVQSKEAFEHIRSLENEAFGPSSIPEERIPLDEWIARSGKKIIEIIRLSFKEQTFTIDRDFAKDFFETPAAKRVFPTERSKLEICGMSESDYTNHFNDLLGISAGEFDFESMLEYDRMIIQYQERRMLEIDQKLRLVDDFAILEQKEDAEFSKKLKYKRSKGTLADQINALMNEMRSVNDSAVEIEAKVKSLEPLNDYEISLIRDSLRAHIELLESKIAELEMKQEKLNPSKEPLEPGPKNDDLKNLEEEKLAIEAKIVELKKIRGSLPDFTFHEVKASIDSYKRHLEKKLNENEIEMKKFSDAEEQVILSLQKIKIKQLEAVERLEKIAGDSGKESDLAYFHKVSLFFDKQKNMLIAHPEEERNLGFKHNNFFALQRGDLQSKKQELGEINGQIKKLYSDILLDESSASGQKYLFDLIDQISHTAKNTFVNETSPAAIKVLRQSTKDVFSDLGHSIGSEKLAQNIAVKMEKSLKESVSKLSFKDYTFLGYLHSPVVSMVDTINEESLSKVIEASLKAVELQINDIELIDREKERILTQEINNVVEAQTLRLIEEIKLAIIFESLHFSIFAKKKTEELDDYATKVLKDVGDAKLPEIEFIDRSKKFSLAVGVVGAAMMVAGGTLAYSSLASEDEGSEE